MQESSGSIDIKEERKVIPDKNVVVMPVEESTNLLTSLIVSKNRVNYTSHYRKRVNLFN